VRREAVAKGLITDAEIDAVLRRLEALDFAVFSPVMFTAWGRRPASPRTDSRIDRPQSDQSPKGQLP
jgi:hypothetical protein